MYTKIKLIVHQNQVDCNPAFRRPNEPCKRTADGQDIRGDAMNRVSAHFWDALRHWLLANVNDGEAVTSRYGNRCPVHACAASGSRVRRFRSTRAPLPVHACAASSPRVRRFQSTHAPLPVHACKPSFIVKQNRFAIYHCLLGHVSYDALDTHLARSTKPLQSQRIRLRFYRILSCG